MNSIIFKASQRIEALSPHDRGLAYGDGLFETMLAVNGDIPWWPAHWQRLTAGARQLAITLPDQQVIRQAAEKLAENQRCVVKIILTRGVSGRGYLPGDGPETCIVSSYPAPAESLHPLSLYWCQTRIAEQPSLAGIKHLNRLENVLARRECALAGHPEGLICDSQGRIICATSANVFVLLDDKWMTPNVSACGIAGITRAWILDNVDDVLIDNLDREKIQSATALFLCNSVRGIMPVAKIGSKLFEQSKTQDDLQAFFLAANPFFGNT